MSAAMAVPTPVAEMIEASAHPTRLFIQNPQFKQIWGALSADTAQSQPAPQPVLALFLIAWRLRHRAYRAVLFRFR
jgi:hypothetical protein